MKVLKKGAQPSGWSKELLCTGAGNSTQGCGALLLVLETDVYATQSSYYDGSTDHYTTFFCPACGTETDVRDPKCNPLASRPSKKALAEIRATWNAQFKKVKAP